MTKKTNKRFERDKVLLSFKTHLLGMLVGAVPGVFLWLLGVPKHISFGVAIFGVIVGEIIGIAVIHDSERK